MKPYPGIDGFLGTRASIMLDVVFLAMFAVILVMGVSIYLVKFRKLYDLHRTIQVALGLILLVAVSAFEVDMQFLTQWEVRAAESPYFPDAFGDALYNNSAEKWGSTVGTSLAIHLFFAVPTAVLWIVVIVRALRNFPKPTLPGPHSRSHLFWARIAAFEMTMTSITGWIFYYLAFVAT